MKVLYVSQMVRGDDASSYNEAAHVTEVFGELGCELKVWDATEDEMPDPKGWDGVVLAGIRGSARDQEDWRQGLIQWLADNRRLAVLGISGGHQALAFAHGATVGPLEEPQVGVYPLSMQGVDGFKGWVFQCHEEQVHHAPRGARLWARDGHGVQAIWYASRRWSVQFHPEFTLESAQFAGEKFGFPAEAWNEERIAEGVESGRAMLRYWLDAL